MPADDDRQTRAKRAAASKKADKLRLTAADVTVALCVDTREADCYPAAAMKESWKHLRKRSEALAKDGVRVAAVPTKCVDVCKFGPLALVHSAKTGPGGAWYGGCDPATLDRVLDAHCGDGAEPAGRRLGG